MKRLIWVFGIFAVIWTIYWFGVRSYGNSLIAAQLDVAREEGWQVETDLHVGGFPFKFDTNGRTLNAERNGIRIDVAEPNASVWAMYPVTLSTDGPWSVQINDGLREVALNTDALKAEISYGLLSLGALERSEGDIDGLKLHERIGPDEARWDIGKLTWVLEDDTGDNLYGLTAYAEQISAEGITCESCDEPFSLALPSAALNGQAQFAAPINLLDVQDIPRFERLILTDANVHIFDGVVTVSGDLTYDADGLATGTITAKVENWGNILSEAEKQGFIEIERARLLRNLVRPIAQNHADVELPLVVRAGKVLIGPVPLGDLPPLRIAQARP